MSDHEPAAWPPQAPATGGGPAEPVAPPVIEHRPEPSPEPVRVVERRGGTPLGLTLLLTAALGGGLYYVWANPKGVSPATDPGPAIAQARSQMEAQVQPLSDQLQSLGGRVEALEKRPQLAPAQATPAADGSTADLAKQLSDLSAKVDALAAKQDGQAAELAKASELAAQKPAEPGAPPPDMTAAQAPALAAQQQVADLGHRVDDAVAKQTQAEQAMAEQKAAADALRQRLEKLEAAAQQGASDEQKKSADTVAALDARVGKLEQGAGAVQGAAKTASRAARLEAAEAALATGQPLGDLPGAGPALTRYAHDAPPTEAGLRGRFPAVADAARDASQPDTAHRSFVDRMLARVQQSVTVRRGDHVILGDPASGVLARAQEAVDRDDLKGAADALDKLTGPAADAARDWVSQVRGLLAARVALADMARG